MFIRLNNNFLFYLLEIRFSTLKNNDWINNTRLKKKLIKFTVNLHRAWFLHGISSIFRITSSWEDEKLSLNFSILRYQFNQIDFTQSQFRIVLEISFHYIYSTYLFGAVVMTMRMLSWSLCRWLFSNTKRTKKKQRRNKRQTFAIRSIEIWNSNSINSLFIVFFIVVRIFIVFVLFAWTFGITFATRHSIIQNRIVVNTIKSNKTLNSLEIYLLLPRFVQITHQPNFSRAISSIVSSLIWTAIWSVIDWTDEKYFSPQPIYNRNAKFQIINQTNVGRKRFGQGKKWQFLTHSEFDFSSSLAIVHLIIAFAQRILRHFW